MTVEAVPNNIWTENLAHSDWNVVVPAAQPTTAIVRAEGELQAIDQLMAELNELNQIGRNSIV